MPPERSHEFLDAGDSEDDHGKDYDSEDEITKGRSAKRRRLDDGDEDEDASDLDREANDDEDDDKELPVWDQSVNDESHGSEMRQDADKSEMELPDVTRSLLKRNLVASEKAIKRSGVIYLSRIPPFMKPAKLRSLLEPYGTINRIFLAPEDPSAHARRVRAGGNKKRSYTEGWVEFVKKKDAKTACDLLNAHTIGGKKGSYYHDDIWNLLYLKGFKWHNLTEQIAAEDAERASRMRAEISKTTKENKDFVKNVERAKMLGGIQAKAKKRQADRSEDGEASRSGARTFAQVPLVKKTKDNEEQPERVTRVLNKIF